MGSTVNIDTATFLNTIGATQLTTLWSDPDSDPAERAFYYARVIEIPGPRWTTYDAVRFGVEPTEGAATHHSGSRLYLAHLVHALRRRQRHANSCRWFLFPISS